MAEPEVEEFGDYKETEMEDPIILLARCTAGEWNITEIEEPQRWATGKSLESAVKDWIDSHSHFHDGDGEDILRRVQLTFGAGHFGTRRKMLRS